jgi:hypothetical protein
LQKYQPTNPFVAREHNGEYYLVTEVDAALAEKDRDIQLGCSLIVGLQDQIAALQAEAKKDQEELCRLREYVALDKIEQALDKF